MFRHKSSAQPVEIARQAADVASKHAANATQAARAFAENIDKDDVRDSLQQAAATTTAAATTAAQVAKELATNVSQTVTEKASQIDLDDVRSTVSDVRDTVTTELNKNAELVVHETRNRPVRSLLIALGLGAVLGAALDRMSRRRKQQARETAEASRVNAQVGV